MEYEERTGRKLRYAKVHLDELAEYPKRGSGYDFERAHCESFLFQLISARDTFFQEINVAHCLGLKEHQVNIFNFSKKIDKNEIRSDAFKELKEMCENQDSPTWLNSAIAFRNASAHCLEFNRVFDDGGKVELIHPKTKQRLGRDYLIDFTEWHSNMTELFRKLRNKLP